MLSERVDKECGICLNNILESGEIFGLLDMCNHSFCLKCIREWRATYIKNMTKEVRRSCPLCKIESYMVIPSNFWAEGEEKDDILEEFKESMGGIPCRHFNMGKGKCPFMNSCFYEHRLPNGELYEYDVRVEYWNEDGELVEEDPNDGRNDLSAALGFC